MRSVSRYRIQHAFVTPEVMVETSGGCVSMEALPAMLPLSDLTKVW